MINILNLNFQSHQRHLNMSLIYKKSDEFFFKVSNKLLFFNCRNIPVSLLKLSSREPKYFFSIFKN